MSVLIRGMKMPKNCKSCPLRYSSTGYAWCDITGESLALEIDMRDDTCPLVELPQHGRLIDAEKLKRHIDKLPALPDGNFAGTHRNLKALINMQKAVIEAEGSDG